MSQQEERHLLERNVNASLQKKVEELQRNLLQVIFGTILEYLNSPFIAYMLGIVIPLENCMINDYLKLSYSLRLNFFSLDET